MDNNLPETRRAGLPPGAKKDVALAITTIGNPVVRLENVIECSFDGIGVVDEEGRLLLVNTGYERITGLRREEVVGRRLSDLVEEGIISEAPSLEAMRQKRTVTAFQKVSTGAEVLITASPLLDAKGRVIVVIGNIRDVTELNRLKEENARYRDLSRLYQSELQELRSRHRFREQIVAQSKEMQAVLDLALRVAQSTLSVLITGETGVGKEVIARVIHMSGERRNGPFVQLNCAAIPATLLESELFGYEPGAFSGALRQGKPGLFELPTTARSCWMRSGRCPWTCRPNCCGCCRTR